MKIKIADIILVAVLLLLCFFPLLMLGESGTEITVSVDGQEVATLSLSEDTRYEIEGRGTVVVSGGQAFFENATCPDKSCEKTGKISSSGQTVICLPSRVVIRVCGQGGVDAVAG